MLRRQRRKVGAAALLLAALAVLPTPAAAQANCDPDTNDSMRERKVSCPEDVLRLSCGGDLFDLDGATCCLIDKDHPVTAYCGTSGEQIDLKCRGATHSVLIEPTGRGLSYNCLAAVAPQADPDGVPDGPGDADNDPQDTEPSGDQAGTPDNPDAGFLSAPAGGAPTD